jgi:hypothetical protein
LENRQVCSALKWLSNAENSNSIAFTIG